METTEIREKFVDFYTSRGYRSLPRAPMVDDSIPMSFVMSAGLVQVEQSLAHEQVRDSNKFVLVQDCFRHFDLDKVGTDDFHLSIFEMPGAFRFGSNSKVETVELMWELATSVLGIDPDRLWASYFRGGDLLGNKLPEDREVRSAWGKLGLLSNRIVGLGVEDNYWLQGKGFNGGDVIRKAGPNTELFFDRGEERACGVQCQPGCKCGRFVEFSNSLFIRYEVNPDTRIFHHLDNPFSETVIGTERIAMFLQGRESVFEIKKYQPILETIDSFVQLENKNTAILTESKRVIADHLRALYLLVSDGAPPPGKNGRERIIKLLIRGIITRQKLLNIRNPDFISITLDCIGNTMSDKDEQVQKQTVEYFENEEKRFLKTVEKGLGYLDQLLEENELLSGEQIVYLEKRKGLPPLLAKNNLKKKGISFPEDSYRMALQLWKAFA